ncbi:MAG TPA: hypothetical protein VFE62_19595, partial [Gemmataceae bacterium]|nr:hypothetical protein [Gemmataceae bacterium]
EQIDMGKPLSAPPLGMKRIDLADVIGTLEEEYRMAISDHAIEGRAGTGFEQAVTKLTPADLVFLVNTSKGNPPRKPMK